MTNPEPKVKVDQELLENDLKLYTLIQVQLSILEKIANKSADIIYLRLIQDANIQTLKPMTAVSEEVIRTTSAFLQPFSLRFDDKLVYLFAEAAISRILRNGDPYMQEIHGDPTADESVELTEEDEEDDSRGD